MEQEKSHRELAGCAGGNGKMRRRWNVTGAGAARALADAHALQEDEDELHGKEQ